MSNNLGSLVVSLGLDAAEFTRGLSKSEYQTTQWLRSLDAGIESARTGALASFAAMGAAAAVLDRQLNDIAGFQDLADKIGDTAQEVASLKLAADLSGTALDTVAGASVKLTTALAKTDDESKGAALGLKAIGIEVGAFKQLSPVAQFEEVAKALSGFEDGAGKTATAVQIFGKSGADLIPILNDLAEEGGRQVTLTGEQIKAADDYSKSTARLRSEVKTLVAMTAADAAPVMTQMVQMLRDTVQYSTQASDGVGLFQQSLGGVRNALQAVLVVGSEVTHTLKSIVDFSGAYAAVSQSLLRGDIAGAKAIGAAFRELGEERRKALDQFQFSVMLPDSVKWTPDEARKRGRLGGFGRPQIDTRGFGGSGGRTGARVPGVTTANAFTGLTYDEQTTQRVANLLESSAVTKGKEYADTLAKLDSLYFSGSIGADLYQSSIDKLTGATDKGAAQATKFIEEQKRLAELLGATESAGIDKQRQDMELLTRALQDGVIGEQKYLEAVSARLNLVASETEKAKSFAEEFGATFSSAFEDAIVGGKGLSEVIQGLEQDILRMATRKMVTEPISNALTSALGSFNLGNLFSFDGGGYTGSGGRAGGLDGKGGFLAMLHPNETVLDHTRGQGGSGQVLQITNHFSLSGPVDRRTQHQIAAAAGRSVQIAAARNG